ncbi:Cell division protein FtsK [Streptococcus mitis]|uniref:DNA translocase FtsK n=1 Tax=Streptococcus mitis TaxID=28037 RepID=A0A150NFK9_STRMT|nr:Cell division protein FtsK [Streptococcus mitis]
MEETFASFGIKVTVERAEIGPSVTKYEVKPAVGVRVNRISNLADDLALALAAKDVRIEAPIPGKSLVGIEVPNSEIATVSFRELWEQSQTKAENLLEIPLGKAVNGTARAFDLSKMPHLLVAGSTGSGKSVAVNGIIASILMKARPDQVKFMMVDPKMVELSVYNDIPHLLIPVVTNPRKASKALQKVVDEMENRYELFAKVGVRNIAGFNAKVEEFNAQSEYKQIPLPLIVVIVDELADLMMVASKEVEDAIIRLGQKARAAGIHMILATQRPSVDVISGLIKANVPSRVAFAVSSGTDSRTILDENGAEKLLGRGDMLFKPIDENHPVRLQGSFISDDDVERIVNFIKAQADADYDESFDPGEVSENDGEFSDGESGGDPLFEEAKALVIETQKASASMIQRRLSVGFNRATRLMEELEMAGVIGPAEGTKPRKVLQQ